MGVTNVSRPGNFEPQRPFGFPDPVPVPKPVLNVKSIAESLKGIIAEELLKVIPDVEGDLQVIASEIAPVLVSAALSGDKALRAELEAQIVAIAEINKIRGNAAAHAAIKRVANFALSVLSVGITAAVKGATGGLA